MTLKSFCGVQEPLTKSFVSRVAGKMRMDVRRATKVVAGTTKPRSATTQTPYLAATRTGRLPRHGQRSLGCGSGSMSARFTVFLAVACAPSRTTLRETESGALLLAVCFVARLAKGNGHWLRLASRIPSRISRRRGHAGLNQRFHSLLQAIKSRFKSKGMDIPSRHFMPQLRV